MFIPSWGLLLMAALYVYLLVTDVRLHRRVKKLEETIMKLEGVTELERDSGNGNGG